MNNYNSKIYLAHNINLDKDCINLLDYTETEMLNLVINNSIASASDFTFINSKEKKNRINVPFTYNTCLQANYLAFQNPNYSNKWFFAFIIDVDYVSNKNTEITFKIDSWSTWFDKFNYNTCFTVREHVSDDTFGLHTIKEDISIGDYINTLEPVDASYDDVSYVCVGVTKNILSGGITAYNPTYNNISSGLIYLVVENGFNLWRLVSEYASSTSTTIDAIHEVFMIPSTFIPNINWITVDANFRYAVVPESTTASFFGTVTFQRNNKVGINYTPKNKKLLCYPYSYLMVSNNVGTDTTFRYEDFANQTTISPTISFDILASIGAGCSIKLVPLDYKNCIDGTRNRNYAYSIMCAKYPVCAWIGDVYTNWLTSNGINVMGMKFDVTTAKKTIAGVQMASSLVTKDGSSLADGVGNLIGAIEDDYRHSMTPPSANGNIAASDVMFSLKKLAPTFYRMSIKDENAKIIDDYFTRFGYKVNSLKIPNFTGRTYFNYVEIGRSDECITGNIPNIYKDEINNILRRGVTIWHNHDNIGNYSLDNTIITE